MKKFSVLFVLLFLFAAGTNHAQLRLSLLAGLNVPTGDLGDNASLGFGFTGSFEYWQNTPLAFTGSIGYNHFGSKEELPSGWDYSLTSVPILVGAKYYLARGDFHPYLGIELGLYIVTLTATRFIGGNQVEIDNSDSEFGLAPMFGFRHHVGSTTDVEFNVKYNIITTEGSNTSYLTLNGGVQIGL